VCKKYLSVSALVWEKVGATIAALFALAFAFTWTQNFEFGIKFEAL
jgi:hypothetical protein